MFFILGASQGGVNRRGEEIFTSLSVSLGGGGNPKELAMRKAELIIEGGDGELFDNLEDAKAVGRAMHRQGRTVHIDVFPESAPAQMKGWRYEPDSDEWFIVALPLRQAS